MEGGWGLGAGGASVARQPRPNNGRIPSSVASYPNASSKIPKPFAERLLMKIRSTTSHSFWKPFRYNEALRAPASFVSLS